MSPELEIEQQRALLLDHLDENKRPTDGGEGPGDSHAARLSLFLGSCFWLIHKGHLNATHLFGRTPRKRIQPNNARDYMNTKEFETFLNINASTRRRMTGKGILTQLLKDEGEFIIRKDQIFNGILYARLRKERITKTERTKAHKYNQKAKKEVEEKFRTASILSPAIMDPSYFSYFEDFFSDWISSKEGDIVKILIRERLIQEDHAFPEDGITPYSVTKLLLNDPEFVDFVINQMEPPGISNLHSH